MAKNLTDSPAPIFGLLFLPDRQVDERRKESEELDLGKEKMRIDREERNRIGEM